MKVFVSVDMEGISGVCHSEDVKPGLPGYEQARQRMAGDLSAAVEGALAAGATDILVNDSHMWMRNVRPVDVPPRVRIISGLMKPDMMMEGISRDLDAAFFIGYHAMAGDPVGVLNHTFAPKQFRKVEINGMEVGETAINAGVAGLLGVPVAMLSGDQALEAEARSFLGDVPVAVVKRAMDKFCAEFVPVDESRRRITETAMRALREVRQRRVFTFESPVTMRITMTSSTMAMMAALIPGCARTGPREVTFTDEDYLVVFRFMTVAKLVAMFCTDPVF